MKDTLWFLLIAIWLFAIFMFFLNLEKMAKDQREQQWRKEQMTRVVPPELGVRIITADGQVHELDEWNSRGESSPAVKLPLTVQIYYPDAEVNE